MLHHEIYGNDTHPNLTFLHGWGAQNGVWRDWAQRYFGDHYQIHLIELPGFGESAPMKNLQNPSSKADLAQSWTQAIIDSLPEKTHLLGWSLGGLLAQNIALQAPNRVDQLILLASTPRFTQTDHWLGAISPQMLHHFLQSVQQDSLGTLKHFWRLQMQSQQTQKSTLKAFVQQMQQFSLPSMTGLIQGLQLLEYFDFRNQLDALTQPSLWLFGEQDPLISANHLEKALTAYPNISTHLLAEATHSPFISHPQETASAIQRFLRPIQSQQDL